MSSYQVFHCETFNDYALGDDENPLRKKFDSIIEDIKENRQTNLGDVKLIKGNGGVKYFRAKLSDTDRLLFKSIKYNDKDSFVLLEVILNHDYNKSKFLKDKEKIKILKINYDEDGKNILDNVEITNTPKIRWLGKFIQLSAKQEDVVENSEGKYNLPLFVNGHAGSGKTSVALEKLRKIEEELEEERILFITQSANLMKQSKELYEYECWDEASNELRTGIPEQIDFLSFHMFLEKVTKDVEGKKAIDRNVFLSWFERICNQGKFKKYKNDADKIFEEFAAVLAGGGLQKEGVKEEYLKLGKRQSIFSEDKRSSIYDLFEEYKKFVNASAEYYDASLIAQECLERIQSEKYLDVYDVVVVDEVQDLTRSMLALVLKCSKNKFLLCGDVNQVIHPSFFSASKLKDFLCKNIVNKGAELKICTLEKNYRNSQQVIELANRILHLKNYCFASEDTITEEEKNYFFMKNETENVGCVGLISDDKEIGEKVSGSTDYAILVLADTYKLEAEKYFVTPLIFNVLEAKGLEFNNIILYKFDEAYHKLWNVVRPNKANANTTSSIIDKIRKSFNEENVNTSKPKDKKDKSFEEHKFYMNALYVGVTRAIDNVYIIGDVEQHKLLKIVFPGEEINVVNIANIEKKESSPKEWKDMALNLVTKGNVEQAVEIGKKLIHEEEYVKEIIDALKPQGWNEKVEDIQSALEQFKSEQLHKLENIKYFAELQIKLSSFYFIRTKSESQSYWNVKSTKKIYRYITLQTGSLYLYNAYKLVNAYKDYVAGSIDDEYIRSVDNMLRRLEFNPYDISYEAYVPGSIDDEYNIPSVDDMLRRQHFKPYDISDEYVDKVFDNVEFFKSKEKGKAYYKLLNGSNKDTRLFVKMVQRGIEVPVKKFMESIKRQLQSFFSKIFLNALKNEDPLAVEDCIKKGLIVDLEVTEGRTALHHAAEKGNAAIVDILLKKAAADREPNIRFEVRTQLSNFVNAKTTFGGDTSLHIAAKKGFFEIVKSLLKYGAIYNIENNEGKTPIELSRGERIKKLLKLIEELFKDAKKGIVQIIDKLKAMKLDELIAMKARNDEGTTLLLLAMQNEFKNYDDDEIHGGMFIPKGMFLMPELLSVFSEKLFDAINNNNFSAVKICIESRRSFVLRDEDGDPIDTEGRTPLHHAVYKGNLDIIKILLENTAVPDKVTTEGYTSLHIASLKNYKEVVEILLEYVKKMSLIYLRNFINARTTAKGRTALHIAAKKGFLEIVKLLLDYGADHDAEDTNMKTPLNLAREKWIQNPNNNVLKKIINILIQQNQHK